MRSVRRTIDETRRIDMACLALGSAAHGAQQGRQIEAAQARGGHIVDEVGGQRALPLQDLADALLDAVRGELGEHLHRVGLADSGSRKLKQSSPVDTMNSRPAPLPHPGSNRYSSATPARSRTHGVRVLQ